MAIFQRPLPRPIGGLNDPRSTGASAKPRPRDLLGLKGTKAG